MNAHTLPQTDGSLYVSVSLCLSSLFYSLVFMSDIISFLTPVYEDFQEQELAGHFLCGIAPERQLTRPFAGPNGVPAHV